MFEDKTVIVRGAGDLATGVGVRLWRCGFRVIMTETARPLTIRRTVSLSEAVYEGVTTVEGVTARRAEGMGDIDTLFSRDIIPVLVDPHLKILSRRQFDVLVDAVLAKRNIGTGIQDASLVIGLGPGFVAGRDVHAVVETKRGHYLGRVIWTGGPAPNTGIPGQVLDISEDRVIRAPIQGEFQSVVQIGTMVKQGNLLGHVNQTEILASISGVVRGLIHNRVSVNKGLKICDIDPRGISDYCRTISDKALAVGGGVLEAILSSMNKRT